MLVVGCAGYFCFHREGLAFRLPKPLQELTSFKYEYKAIYRYGTFFLAAGQDYSTFRTCGTSPTDGNNKKSLLLWGDSYAAHLYPGYKAYFGQKFNIVQRTAGTCPPVLHMGIDSSPKCQGINDHIFEAIRLNKPDKVVLAANWVAYDWIKVEGTINELRGLGITDIDLIGPEPLWIDGLPKELSLYYRHDKNHQIPDRMKFGLNQSFIETDALMFDFAEKLQVNYISPRKIMCNELGCITKLGESGDKLVAWDLGHLTETGSLYLVSHFPGK